MAGEAWLEVPMTAALSFAGARPNPSSGTPLLAFSLPRGGPARLEVIDVAGRRVRDQRWEGLAAGEHRLRLDGTLAPGVYLLRLSHGGESRVARVNVIR
jgi:hypothetical protein